MSLTCDLPHIVVSDCLDLLRGEKLGSGRTREVWSCALNPAWVIKFETSCFPHDDVCFQNIMEWDHWGRAKKVDKWAKWFAPCHYISPLGSVLMMSKTTPLKKLPARVPSFFYDLKAVNWGELNGRPVCHDYGVSRLGTYGLIDAKMVKAEWTDGK